MSLDLLDIVMLLFSNLLFWVLMRPASHSCNIFDHRLIEFELRCLVDQSLLWSYSMITSISLGLRCLLFFINLIWAARYPLLNQLLKIIGQPLVFLLLWPALSQLVSHIDVWCSAHGLSIGNCHDLLLKWLLGILHLSHVLLPSLYIFMRSHLINTLTFHAGLSPWKRRICWLVCLLVNTVESWLDSELLHFCILLYCFLILIFEFWFINSFIYNFDLLLLKT